MDPEIKAMHTVQKVFDGLDVETRGRVLEWVAKKYGMQFAGATLESTEREPGGFGVTLPTLPQLGKR